MAEAAWRIREISARGASSCAWAARLYYTARMNLYDLTVPQLIKMLKNVDQWLTSTIAQAEKKKYDVNNLLKFRLSPDQFAFDRQIQTLCDNAKFVAGRQLDELTVFAIDGAPIASIAC